LFVLGICSLLLQSYRFATIDDYICLAEQMADTYNMAKTELVESLTFTLNGFASCTESVTDMSQLNVNTEMVTEYPTYNIPNLVPKLTSVLQSNIHEHISDSTSAYESLLGPFADKPSGSASSSEAFIPHARMDDLSEDPDISTAEDNVMRANKRDFISLIEGMTCEEDKMYPFLSDNSSDDSDEVDSNCDEVEEDDGEEQEKNLNIQKKKIMENQEEENGKFKKEEETKGLNKSLNIFASAFEPSAKIHQEQKENSYHKEDTEAKMAAGIVSAPAEEIHLNAKASEYNVLGKSYAVCLC
jgi:hypothetical protein